MAENEKLSENESQDEESEQPEKFPSEAYAGTDEQSIEEGAAPSEGPAETEHLDDREPEDESAGEEEESMVGDASPAQPTMKKKKPKRLVSRVLEYDIEEMYPEMELLVARKKNEWDYQDPAIIRALWLESKTNILAEWKVRNMKFNRKKKKPTLEVRETLAFTLRKDYLQEKAQKPDEDMLQVPVGNDPPIYKAVQLPTNLTMEVRYNFVRNNPPVPRWYVEHFHKYKKPPFLTHPPQACHTRV